MFIRKIHYFYGGFPLFHVTYLHPWKTSGASKAKSCRETDNQAWKMTCDSWQSHGGHSKSLGWFQGDLLVGGMVYLPL
jgi:hypothetical protein